MILVPLLTFALAALGCGLYLRLARRWQILDRPNERSSHVLPTPHGGGAPALLALAAGVAVASVLGVHWDVSFLALLGLAGVLVALGAVDDLLGLPVGLRFALYGLCCVLGVLAALGVPGSGPGAWLWVMLAAFGLLWMLNLYNFMDGIDGLAASQCILACCIAAALAALRGSAGQYPLFCLALAGAHAGFLVWNWPPARLFMGDTGSVPTGFLLGGLALLGARQSELPLACWLILLAAFVTDATVTLLWRMYTRQPFTRPHRLHAYQRLSRHFGGHFPVVLILLALQLLWLAPLAALAAIYPQYAASLVILAYIPLLAGMAKAGKVG